MDVFAGYGRVSGLASAGDRLLTSGLAGCIAVVVHNSTAQRAFMAHVDPARLAPVAGQELAGMQRFRDQLVWIGQRQMALDRANSYSVGLGNLWRTLSRERARGAPTIAFTLVRCLNLTFHVNPAVFGQTLAYVVADKRWESLGNQQLAAGWEEAGVEIDYLTIAYPDYVAK